MDSNLNTFPHFLTLWHHSSYNEITTRQISSVAKRSFKYLGLQLSPQNLSSLIPWQAVNHHYTAQLLVRSNMGGNKLHYMSLMDLPILPYHISPRQFSCHLVGHPSHGNIHNTFVFPNQIFQFTGSNLITLHFN